MIETRCIQRKDVSYIVNSVHKFRLVAPLRKVLGNESGA